jgi:hypothetical protein
MAVPYSKDSRPRLTAELAVDRSAVKRMGISESTAIR